MVAIPIADHVSERAHGLTSAGKDVFILSRHDLPPSSLSSGVRRVRVACPLCHSHTYVLPQTLSLDMHQGWGRCFRCHRTVFLAESNARLAAMMKQRYQQMRQSLTDHRTVAASPEPPATRHDEERQWLTTLHAQGAFQLDRSSAWNAQAYLEAWHIPLELAQESGVGYVDVGASKRYGAQVLQRWEDHLLIPVFGYDVDHGLVASWEGGLLSDWQQCSRDLFLEPQRWVAVAPMGWFWEPLHLSLSEPTLVVDGPLDRLALLATGHFRAHEVVALMGHPFDAAWLRDRVHSVLLAGRSQRGGDVQRGKQTLASKRYPIVSCRIPANDRDAGRWYERWRLRGTNGLEPLYAEQALLSYGL